MLISLRYRSLSRFVLVCLMLSFANNRSTTAASQTRVEADQTNVGAVCRLKPQMAPIPYHEEARSIQSGYHTAPNRSEVQAVFSTLVQSLDAPWVQVQFGTSDLGHHSHLRLTALSDGASQELDAPLLAAWNNRSAMFNGDTVKVELLAAPDDKDVFFEVKAVVVGEWAGGVPLQSSRPTVSHWSSSISKQLDVTHYRPDNVCGADDRVASTDQAVGRIVPIGCTGWVISNGAFLTAGHCNTGNMTSIQFNVPASKSDGTINPPPPADQFPIDATSITSVSNGSGDDWAVFRVNHNSASNLTPPLAYGSFYRVYQNDKPATVRVTGYGVDGPAPCYGESRQPGCTNPSPPLNADSQTQQTDTGPSKALSGSHLTYMVDTEGGNSGSPVRYSDQWLAVAIHTHGHTDAACTADFNGGTTFANTALAAAVNNFPGADTRYVDANFSLVPPADGSYFHPYNLVTLGVANMPAGGTLSIVAGHYNESLTISNPSNTPLILEAPVGTVVIGIP